MIFRKTWLILMLAALMALWGCSDDDGPTTPPTVTPFEYLAAVTGAVINDNAITPHVISADALFNGLQENPPLYTVIDIRQTTHFNEGHIPGAYHSTLATLLDDLENTIPDDKDYVVVCYTGQSAGHAKFAMEMMGYTPVYSLGWGMCSWNSSLASRWTNACADLLDTPETTNQNLTLGEDDEFDFPVLDGPNSTVVERRVASMLAGGFKGIGYAALDPAVDYFIVNYHSLADYLGNNQATSGIPGHIPGAYQFTPYQSLGISQMLKYLPSDDTPIIIYCWTGQHSSQVAAYLNMLGYNAYSLSFGVNSLFYTDLITNKWDVGTHSRAYPLTDPILK